MNSAATTVGKSNTKGFVVKAIYDYTAADKDEVCFVSWLHFILLLLSISAQNSVVALSFIISVS